MKKRYPSRHWALVSAEAGAGKSTFVASNSRPPVYVIDSDGRFDAVEKLVPGKVLMPRTRAGRGIGKAGAIVMMNEAEDAVDAFEVNTIVVDSVTKIFEYHARRASMAGNLSPEMRQSLGFNKLKAKDMVDKSNAMSVLATLAALGTDMYYIWHMRNTIDVNSRTFDPMVRDRISKVELETLGTSIAVRLNFFKDGNGFGITVESARDLGDRKSNTGFTIYDTPGNYWRGAAERLERLIYTSFSSAEEAIKWAMRELGNDDPGEIEGLYDFVKTEARPKTPADMWVAWITHVDDLLSGRAAPAPEPAPIPEPAPAPEPAPIPEPAPAPEPAMSEGDIEMYYYVNGAEVSQEDLVDFKKYQEKFGKRPHDDQMLLRAVKMGQDSPSGW